MTDEQLAEIRGRNYSIGFAWAEKTGIPIDMLEAMHSDVSALLDEVERLRGLNEDLEVQLDNADDEARGC